MGLLPYDSRLECWFAVQIVTTCDQFLSNKKMFQMAFNEHLEMDSYQKNKNTIESILALKPDARPLYRYRISYSQFLHLQAYLSENHLSFYDVVKVTKFSNGLDKLFVLYATE